MENHPDHSEEMAGLDAVSLHDIYARLGSMENKFGDVESEVAGLKAEIREGLNGSKVPLKERVRSLEGRWNRMVGALLLFVAGVSGFEVWKNFIQQ